MTFWRKNSQNNFFVEPVELHTIYPLIAPWIIYWIFSHRSNSNYFSLKFSQPLRGPTGDYIHQPSNSIPPMQSKNKQSNIHSVVAKLGNDKDSDYLKEPKKTYIFFPWNWLFYMRNYWVFKKKKNPFVLKTVLSKYRLKNVKCFLTQQEMAPFLGLYALRLNHNQFILLMQKI